MVRAVILTVLFGSGLALWAQDHQRVGGSAPAVHRLEAGVDGNFVPLGFALWDLGLTPRIGYEWQKTWSLSLGLPYTWASEPETRTVVGTLGQASLGLNWAGGSNDLHWRFGSDLVRDRPVSVDFSVQWVRDPVILGILVGVTFPGLETGLSGQGTLFFQEVVNDALTWSLVLSPQCLWYDGLPLWTVSLAWKVGWYEGGSSFSSGVSTGTGAPWTWLASAAQTWDFP